MAKVTRGKPKTIDFSKLDKTSQVYVQLFAAALTGVVASAGDEDIDLDEVEEIADEAMEQLAERLDDSPDPEEAA